ncbi:MAG TPA: gfo/Idh/MocA family oxidoreductase, partial [Solibacterales bacterium]|nr:gfo/Idh/MocA family oxidoreductase [Bryobacterales bacterium]
MIAWTASSYSRVLGANDRIRLGAIGVGDRGRHVMGLFQQVQGLEVAAVCDVYANMIDMAKQKAPAAQSFSDHRKLLEVKELDAVLIATP